MRGKHKFICTIRSTSEIYIFIDSIGMATAANHQANEESGHPSKKKHVFMVALSINVWRHSCSWQWRSAWICAFLVRLIIRAWAVYLPIIFALFGFLWLQFIKYDLLAVAGRCSGHAAMQRRTWLSQKINLALNSDVIRGRQSFISNWLRWMTWKIIGFLGMRRVKGHAIEID